MQSDRYNMIIQRPANEPTRTNADRPGPFSLCLFSHGSRSYARSFTAFSVASPLKARGAVALVRSPPSTVMLSLAAPSS